MKKVLLFTSFLLILFSCETKQNQESAIVTENVLVPSLDYEGLKPMLNKSDNKVYVVNFWATWCAPCVKELPYFEQINQDYKDKNVEVLLVSLDFPNQKEKKLIPYIKKKNLQSKVVLLDDSNEQVWIDKISKDWTGAIPATLIYNKDQRKFFEKSFTLEELENELQAFLK